MMKKIRSKILKARSYVSIKTYKHPMLFVISLMVLLNIIILFIAAIIAVNIDDSFDNVIDAFANGSLKWMLTPNAILQITNPDLLILAVIVLIIGMVLFTGTIIALTTNTIKEYFQKKQSGSGKIYLDEHIVILNWNNKVPELVADLIHVENIEVHVVILADIEKSFAEKQILNAINKAKNNNKELSGINVLVKKGSPLLFSDLNDISIEKARAILIMNKDMYDEAIKNLSKSDLNVIKTILSLGRIEFIYGPPIVAEIKKIETKEKILTMSKVVKTLHEHTIMPICFDRRLGHIIAQTILDPKMEDVYLSLFSFDDSEVYMLKDVDFEDAVLHSSHAIPITRKGRDIFALSLNEETVKLSNDTNPEILQLKCVAELDAKTIDVYIVGKNNKLSFISDSFKEYEALYQSHFSVKIVDNDDIEMIVKASQESDNPITIVLLSDEEQEPDSLDANVIDNLIYLQGKLENRSVNIIVELLDPKNDHIIKDFDIDNTIISNKIISLLLSKLALYQETADFYENLLTIKSDMTGKDDQNIFIVKAKDFLVENFPLEFKTIKSFIVSLYYNSKKVYIPIGIIRDEKLVIFEGDMNRNETFKVEQNDNLVLFKI